jgi:cation-transporting ATPase E
MRDILKLYLSRNFVLAFMIALVFAFFGKMPFLPTENAFYAIATVSFAAFLMAIWAQPRENKGAILPDVLHYAIPTAAIMTLFGFIIYVLFYTLTMNGSIVIEYTTEQLAYLGWPTYDVLPPGVDILTRTAEINARNAMLLFVILAGITQMFMVTPYFKCFSVDGNLHHDIRPTLLAFLLYAFVYAMYNWSFSAKLINLAVFPIEYVAAILIAVVLWFLVTRFMLRKGLFGFLTDITEKWYKKKLDEAYSTKED